MSCFRTVQINTKIININSVIFDGRKSIFVWNLFSPVANVESKDFSQFSCLLMQKNVHLWEARYIRQRTYDGKLRQTWWTLHCLLLPDQLYSKISNQKRQNINSSCGWKLCHNKCARSSCCADVKQFRIESLNDSAFELFIALPQTISCELTLAKQWFILRLIEFFFDVTKIYEVNLKFWTHF